MQNLILQELTEAQQILTTFLEDPEKIKSIEQAARFMGDAILAGHKIISCGNGGSHCDAMHFAEEFTGRYRENRRSLPAIAICEPAYISCTANDFGYDSIFSRFVEGVGSPGDVLLAISTSGNSPNIIEAVKAAQAKGMKVVVLSGKDGGKLAGMADVEVRVPHFGYADRIQEVHIKIIHILVMLVEKLVVGT